jgi:hypothetical protein
LDLLVVAPATFQARSSLPYLGRSQPPPEFLSEPPARGTSVGEGFSIEKDPGGKEDAASLGQSLTGRRIEIHDRDAEGELR